MTKTIKRKEFNNIIRAIATLSSTNAKNIIGLRCEKIGKKINEIATKFNSEISDIDEEHASTDKDFNFMREEVVITDKSGSSKKESTGGFKYTFKRSQERKDAIEKFWNENTEIPVNVVERTDKNTELYKKVIEENSFTTLSNLSGIILDIPLDAEGFVDEEWVLKFLSGDTKKEESNGQSNSPKLEATIAE